MTNMDAMPMLALLDLQPPFSSFLALLSARVSVTFMRLLEGNSMQNIKRFSVEFYR